MTCEGARTERGFSLVELLVVVAIMGVLASVALPLAELSHQRAKEEDLRRGLREIRNAIDAYKQLVDEGAIQRSADESGYPSHLAVLVDGVVNARSSRGAKFYLLRSLPRDPFAPADTPAIETWNTRSYASPPNDPKPGKDVFDVHSKVSSLGLNGIPYASW